MSIKYYFYSLLHFKNFSLPFDEILFTIKIVIVNKLQHRCIHEACVWNKIETSHFYIIDSIIL